MKAKFVFIITATFVALALLLGWAAKEAQNSYAYTNNRGQIFAGNSAYASGGTWTTKAPMSVPRDRAAAVALDGKVYVIGGTNSSGALASMEVYDPATNTWTTKASMPGPKSEPGAAVANGRIYVVGPPDNQLYEYNPATNTWAIKASLPVTPAGAVAVASISGQIFVTFNVSGESRWRLYVYDPFQDTWERRSDHPDDRRSIASLGVSNGMIYAVGGGIAGQTPQETTRIDRYDPSNDQWTVNAIPPMATPRTHLGATLPTIYGRMFVFGGWDGYTALASAEVYDPWTNTWSALPPMPTARYKAAYAAVGYKIYVIGGNWGGAGGHWLTTNEEFSLPEPAQPENPIVFVSGWDEHYYYEIFTMNPDGSHQLRLTNDGCANWHPTWTPDGKRILFSTDCRGHRDIYSMNPDGSDWRRLTFTPGWDVAIATRPFMSPDGRTIAFLQGLPPDNMHIWLMNSDGSNLRQLTTGPGTEDDTAIAWSPDSRQIVFRSTRSGNWQLWRINVDGTGLTQLTNLPDEAHDPAWSPDGSTIAFASQGEIMLMNPDGSNIRTLPGPGWEFRPAWSPDGTRLVYGSYRGNTCDIYSKKIDNTDERNLTNRPDSSEWDPAWARIVGGTIGERKTLLYGGATAQTVFGDLWQYDGNDWTEVAWTGPGPGIRNHHGMVFDERRGRIVVFGGHDGTQVLGDTWEYSPLTGAWTPVTTAHRPSPRYDAEMAYDKRRGVTVLFGGTPGQYIFYNDTWEYDGRDWRQINTPHSPPGALDGAMVYDEARGRVVLVTGWQAQGFGWVNETWEYDGTDWTYITQAPSWRYNFALAYDSVRQRVVLFGGFEHGGIGCGLGDTWEYDGQGWTRITTPHAPPGRCGHAMTYDPSRQRVVLFGGDVGGGNYYGDTWEYDGSDWYQVPTSHQPPGRVWATLIVVTGGEVGPMPTPTPLPTGTPTLTPSPTGTPTPTPTPSPTSTPTPTPMPGAQISGRVVDGSGNPIAGVLISSNRGYSIVTGPDGRYTLRGLPAGIYTITPSKSGYTFSPTSRTVSVPPDATGVDFVGQANSPVITKVQSCFRGSFYPQGLSILNRYKAFVNWQQSTPGAVDFSLNRTSRQGTMTSYGAYTDYNMGQDLQYGVLWARNTLEVTARNSEGRTSEPYRISIIGFNPPRWLGERPPVSLSPHCQDGWDAVLRFKWNLAFPAPPFGGKVTPPSWFPYLGGKTFGIKDTQAVLGLEAASDGTGLASLSGQTGFELAGQEVSGKVFGQGDVTIQGGEGLQLTKASMGLEINGSVKRTIGVVNLIPALSAAENWPIVGPVIRWFNERAKIEGDLSPAVDLTARFHSTQEGWKWDSLTGMAKVRATLALILEVLSNELTAKVYGGGEPRVEFQVPPQPSYLKKVALQILAGVELTVWRFQHTFEAVHEWYYSPGGASSQMALGEGGTRIIKINDWHPIPRNYATQSEKYAVFRANEKPIRLAGRPEALARLGIQATEENLIASNVFPESHPVIAADGNVLLLWVHDDISKPLMQGEEILYSVYNGSTWSSPAGITNDNLQDFAPQVAFDGMGKAVAVWERNKLVQTTSSQLDDKYANAFEIAYAVWNGTTWSAPAFLTNNNALDHSPLLIRGNDGKLFLIWRQNPAGKFIGTPEAPETLYWAVWDGAAWSPPQVLISNAIHVLDITAARHDGTEMGVVYTLDTDGNLSTSEDQELYMMLWNGYSWTTPTRLTSDGEPDNHPTLIYDASGHPRLLWLKGQTLYALLNGLNSTPVPIAAEESAAVLDYVAAWDRIGNIVLFWQGHSEEGVDVFYSVYDQAHNVFSLVQQLTHDLSAEKFMAPAFAPTGELLMAYGKDSLITTTVTLSPTLVVSNVVRFRQSDLYVLRHTLGPDLALTADDILVEPNNPVPGTVAQVKVTIHNIGNRPVENPMVAVYLGDPTSGGVLIGTATANLLLRGGMTATLQVNWNVPSSGGPFTLYAMADPHGLVSEWSKANNKAFRYVSVPDLIVRDIRVSYGPGQTITLTAMISNVGVVKASGVRVGFRLGDPVAGLPIGEVTLDNLEAGTEAPAQLIWDAFLVATGWHIIYALADSNRAIAEANEDNNIGWVYVGLLPDPALRLEEIRLSSIPGKTEVTIPVFNLGIRGVANLMLGLYDQEPISGTVPIALTRLSVPAQQSQTVTITLNTWLPGFYVGLNVNHEIEEIDISNNIVMVGTALRVYLPLVLRNR